MAVGNSSKGGRSSNNNGGRPYGMILLLAFGAAVFGVMVVHKFRERRIFNLLIQDKDRHILSLHLLLQKERDATKEAKRKVEELKGKTFSLRTQKIELHNKLLEMQSTTSSLKEEHKVLESALGEKQNEINILREKETHSNNENSQNAALREILRQKEAEIADLKGRLGQPIKVWSVSTDDPSKPPMNFTLNGASGNVENNGGESEGVDAVSKDEQSDEFLNLKRGSSRMEGKGDAGEKNSQAFVGIRENDRNTPGSTVNSVVGEISKTKSGHQVAMNEEKHENPGVRHSEKLEISQNGKGLTFATANQNGMTLQLPHRSRSYAGSRVGGDPGNRTVTKMKRRRIISRGKTAEYKDGTGERTGGSTFLEDTLNHRRGRMTTRGGQVADNGSLQDHKFSLRIGGTAAEQNTSALDKLGEVSEQHNHVISENATYDEGMEGEDKAMAGYDEKQKIARKSRDKEPSNLRGEKRKLKARIQGTISRDFSHPHDVEHISSEVTNADSNQHVGEDDGFVSKERQIGNPLDSDRDSSSKAYSDEFAIQRIFNDVTEKAEDQEVKLAIGKQKF